jgi:hypothetical protein
MCLVIEYLDIEAIRRITGVAAMTTTASADPLTNPAPTDLSDSLDVRLLAAGKITPTAIPLRRDRAELAAVLGRSLQPRADHRADSPIERIAR